MSESRASKMAKNAVINIVFFFLTAATGILSRRYFFDALSPDIIGLRTSVSTLLSSLSLVELGIGSAIVYSLYKPFADKDTQTINEIISLQAWFYRWVAIIIAVGTAVLSLIFGPFILNKYIGPAWHFYATILVSLLGTIFQYFFNFRSIVFSVTQRDYRLLIFTQSFDTIKAILQIFVLYYFKDHPQVYAMVLGLEFLKVFAMTIVIEKLINKDYPWLKPTVSEGRQLMKKYPEIITKTKQLFAQKIGYTISSQASPFLMTTFVSFAMIGYHSNYMVLISYLSTILMAAFNSMPSGVGSLMAEGNWSKIWKFFWEYNAIKHYIAGLISFAVYVFSPYIIPLWIGTSDPGLVMENTIVAIIVAYSYLTISQGVLTAHLHAKGMFGDIWAVYIEAALLFGLGALGGWIWGLPGVIVGAMVSNICITHLWKCYYLFVKGFEMSPWIFWRSYLKFPIIAAAFIALGGWIVPRLGWDFSTFPKLFINGGIIGGIFFILYTGLLLLVSQGLRDIFMRTWEFMRPHLRRYGLPV